MFKKNIFCHTNLFFKFWHRWAWIIDVNNVNSLTIISCPPFGRYTRRVMASRKHKNSASTIGQLKYCRSGRRRRIKPGTGKSNMCRRQRRQSFSESFKTPVSRVVVSQYTTVNFASLQFHHKCTQKSTAIAAYQYCYSTTKNMAFTEQVYNIVKEQKIWLESFVTTQ